MKYEKIAFKRALKERFEQIDKEIQPRSSDLIDHISSYVGYILDSGNYLLIENLLRSKSEYFSQFNDLKKLHYHISQRERLNRVGLELLEQVKRDEKAGREPKDDALGHRITWGRYEDIRSNIKRPERAYYKGAVTMIHLFIMENIDRMEWGSAVKSIRYERGFFVVNRVDRYKFCRAGSDNDKMMTLLWGSRYVFNKNAKNEADNTRDSAQSFTVDQISRNAKVEKRNVKRYINRNNEKFVENVWPIGIVQIGDGSFALMIQPGK